MSELGQRPNTTCGFRQKVARKPHRCSDCSGQIEAGTLYVQDDYYAPFGNGQRFCLACAQDRERAETEWMLEWDTKWNKGRP